MTFDETLQANEQRRRLVAATAAAGGIAAVTSAIPFVKSMAPSERARTAGAPVTADISRLAPGQLMTVGWRGSPVWILRRTPQMIDGLTRIESELLDPESRRAPSSPIIAATRFGRAIPGIW